MKRCLVETDCVRKNSMDKHGFPATELRNAQVKVSVPTDLAAAFKSACAAKGFSMASAIAGFMREQTAVLDERKPPADPYATRGRRRKALLLLTGQLSDLMAAERRYLENIPENLQGSRHYEAAEQTTTALEDALDILSEAY